MSGPLGEAQLSVFDRERPFDHAQVMRVADAIGVLQAQRTRVAAAALKGTDPHTEICARGARGINRWMVNTEHHWREMLSIRPRGRVEELRISLPLNRKAVADGIRMVSIFDYDSTTPEARLMLAAETEPSYRLAPAPMQMKILDRRQVLLDGPVVDGEVTLMLTANVDCFAAASAYWRAALETSVPSTQAARRVTGLTDRQHQVMMLLSADVSDDQIASTLGVSVRTVRSDIAKVMSALGVQSRFSLGRAISELLGD